ncbi:hypothetical protein EW145_g7604 [Phellinidium pouzarii]|uniref:DUF6532 domain-containing protein n=1 Tax=Phellinidium pouzarii TaxID=167371 RepID=A0A4S4KLE0_9AGAM|nr:hypothetical protein EW145_g7604 [Phellinidium pouzarii]
MATKARKAGAPRKKEIISTPVPTSKSGRNIKASTAIKAIVMDDLEQQQHIIERKQQELKRHEKKLHRALEEEADKALDDNDDGKLLYILLNCYAKYWYRLAPCLPTTNVPTTTNAMRSTDIPASNRMVLAPMADPSKQMTPSRSMVLVPNRIVVAESNSAQQSRIASDGEDGEGDDSQLGIDDADATERLEIENDPEAVLEEDGSEVDRQKGDRVEDDLSDDAFQPEDIDIIESVSSNNNINIKGLGKRKRPQKSTLSPPTLNAKDYIEKKLPKLEDEEAMQKQGRLRSKNNDYSVKLRDTLICAEIHFRASISTIYGFPSRAQNEDFIRTSWTKAMDKIGQPFDLTKDLVAVDGLSRKSLFQHKILQQLLNAVWFKTLEHDGFALRPSFITPIIPFLTLALMVTAIQNALEEWQTGKFQKIPFSAELHAEKYCHILDEIQSLALRTKESLYVTHVLLRMARAALPADISGSGLEKPDDAKNKRNPERELDDDEGDEDNREEGKLAVQKPEIASLLVHFSISTLPLLPPPS